ncbi:MAG: SHOCT domain-containing protein [Burkholderiaceae bacterium]
MQQLTPAGEQIISDIAQRHGYGTDAVRAMLYSVIHGNGSMAQFNHPEFSGSGQWMRGGMTMVSDMFNNQLKNRIDSLCNELSALIANQPDLVRRGNFQSQSQGTREQTHTTGGEVSAQQQSGPDPSGPVSLFVAPAHGTSGSWWPGELKSPNSVGSQNGARYAYFAAANRLAIDTNGHVTVYNTLDHQIGGFSQQQSAGGSMSFNSQHGLVDVSSLPVVSIDGVEPNAPQHEKQSFESAPAESEQAPVNTRASGQDPVTSNEVFEIIEKLAALFNKGILSKEEFDNKKAELLSRL